MALYVDSHVSKLGKQLRMARGSVLKKPVERPTWNISGHRLLVAVVLNIISPNFHR